MEAQTVESVEDPIPMSSWRTKNLKVLRALQRYRTIQRLFFLRRVNVTPFSSLRRLFVTFILFVFVTFMFWTNGDKVSATHKSTVRYPDWRNKKSSLQACGMPVQNNPMVKVRNLNTYLVSSFIEHRLDEKKIRTIAIVLREEIAQYHCVLCCNGQLMSTPATYDIHYDHFKYIYGTADIMCKIPEMCITPSYLAVTSGPPQKNGSLKEIRAFLPIRNQQPHKVFPYKFTICISTMFEYDNVLMLVQAMEMFKILGAQKVAVYKTSSNPVIQKVLNYYINQNFVDLIPWHIAAHINVSRGWNITESPGHLHYWGQLAALNDCLYRYMYQSQYLAMQDLDEFILPLYLHNWSELIPVLEKKYGHNVGFEFETFFFPISITDSTPEYSPRSWKKVLGDNILEHIYRLDNKPDEINPFKVITNPRLVFQSSVHGFLESVNNSIRVDANIVHLYHIRNVTVETILQYPISRDTRLRDFADVLIPAVSGVLEQALNIV